MMAKLIAQPVLAAITMASAGFSWLIAVVKPWQENIDWTLRVVASCVAISVGLYSLYDRRRKRRSTRDQ